MLELDSESIRSIKNDENFASINNDAHSWAVEIPWLRSVTRIKVHVDGGIRSGADIFKALALGADCCWIGRPAIWGLEVCVNNPECCSYSQIHTDG